MIEQGKLRERVKKGEVSAKEARTALLALRKQGQIVGDEILAWLERRDKNTVPQEPKKTKVKRTRKPKEIVAT